MAEKKYVIDNPALMAEWNWEKNATLDLKPTVLTVGSEKKAWWICTKGHEWQAVIYSRTYGSGCPICNAERRTSFPEYVLVYYLKKYNLEVIQSYKAKGYELDVYIPLRKIAIEYDGYFWHKNKTRKDLEKNTRCQNDGIQLYRLREGLSPLNDTSIDYVIRKDHKNFEEIIKTILNQIIGCEVDIDIVRDSTNIENLRNYTEKENSLAFFNPEIANEWNYEKNGTLKPENFLPNSQKKVWWKCVQGHEWQATLANRNSGYGCPYCTGQKVIIGFNDLQTLNPTIAAEWNFEKNENLTPGNFTANSHKKVWWKCSEGHEWQAVIKNRNYGHGCPYCAVKRGVIVKKTLQESNPHLAKEWDYKKNNDLTPADVSPNTTKKVWWICNKGHEWQARIDHRNKGSGCPYCAGQKVLQGVNDLQTLNPLLANEWNYEKNNGLTPMDVMPNSHKQVWWKCKHSHEWKMSIKDRSRGCVCPYCSKRRKT